MIFAHVELTACLLGRHNGDARYLEHTAVRLLHPMLDFVAQPLDNEFGLVCVDTPPFQDVLRGVDLVGIKVGAALRILTLPEAMIAGDEALHLDRHIISEGLLAAPLLHPVIVVLLHDRRILHHRQRTLMSTQPCLGRTVRGRLARFVRHLRKRDSRVPLPAERRLAVLQLLQLVDRRHARLHDRRRVLRAGASPMLKVARVVGLLGCGSKRCLCLHLSFE